MIAAIEAVLHEPGHRSKVFGRGEYIATAYKEDVVVVRETRHPDGELISCVEVSQQSAMNHSRFTGLLPEPSREGKAIFERGFGRMALARRPVNRCQLPRAARRSSLTLSPNLSPLARSLAASPLMSAHAMCVMARPWLCTDRMSNTARLHGVSMPSSNPRRTTSPLSHSTSNLL